MFKIGDLSQYAKDKKADKKKKLRPKTAFAIPR